MTSANATITLNTSLEDFPEIGLQRAVLFRKLGIRRPVDLLFFFPREYQPACKLTPYHELQSDSLASVLGVVDSVEARYSQDGRSSVGVLLKLEPAGFVRLVWYNQPFRAKNIARGDRLQASGNVKGTGLSYEMRHPEVIKLEAGDQAEIGKPKAIYKLTEGLQQRHISLAVNAAVEHLASHVEDAFSKAMLQELDLMSIEQAIFNVHVPDTLEIAARARRRFVFQELLVYQLALAIRRNKLTTQQAAPSILNSGTIHHRILKRIGLKLTGDQEKVIDEICDDMRKTIAMNRLLQGDVGSGKTAVALYAMLLAVANGYQTTFMAPTEILARQHFDRMRKTLANADSQVELLVGSLTASQKDALQHQIALGTVDIVIGTQALLSDKVEFHKLGLAVIDEQHKFGVAQRATLRGCQFQPHYLVLSATPIPRTLAMTAFGDLDVSTIREKPPGREPVHTYLGTSMQAESWWTFVRKKVAEGRQAYVITPRVIADEVGEVVGAEQTFETLRKGELAGLRVGLLHGRIEPETKNATLAAFDRGEIDVLVATTVVEVGIDVANATVMAILDANRLGLAQLHQLRGRVNRGSYPGYVCVFASAGVDPAEHEKLRVFSQTNDGFELAQQDMIMRGPGNLLGTAQTGLPPFRIADLIRDSDVLEQVRPLAQQIIAADAELANQDLAILKKQVLSRHGGMIDFGDVG